MKNLSTRSKLILLVIVSALPALALTLYSALEQRALAKAGAQEELVRVTKLAAREQGQIIEGVRQGMLASSQVLNALQSDQAGCNRYFAKLLAQNRGKYHGMGLFNADGELICSAVPWKGKLSAADRGYFQLAKASGEFSIGDFQTGRVSKQESVNFGYPVKDADGKVTAVAFVSFGLDSFNRGAAATPLPQDSNITVLDRNGVVLGRHPVTAATQVGRKLQNAQVLGAAFSRPSGVFEGTTLDGVGRLYVHEAVARNPDDTIPIRILVSLPLSDIFADENKALLRNLVGIALATMLLLLCAWYGTEVFVLRNIRTLLDTARRVRSGDLGARTGLHREKDELNQVGREFDEMAETLQRRDLELKKAMQELQEQAITDPLTGLHNMRYLRELLPRELLRARRRDSPLAAIMIDVDHFKRVNDSLGHEAGDEVLKELGALLKKSIRGSDIACRYGGEEFVIILADATSEGARLRAEDIRAAVKRLELSHGGKPIGGLTVSLGVALFPYHADQATSLLRKADEALYQAKEAGRDQVVVSDAGAAAQGSATSKSRSAPAS